MQKEMKEGEGEGRGEENGALLCRLAGELNARSTRVQWNARFRDERKETREGEMESVDIVCLGGAGKGGWRSVLSRLYVRSASPTFGTRTL